MSAKLVRYTVHHLIYRPEAQPIGYQARTGTRDQSKQLVSETQCPDGITNSLFLADEVGDYKGDQGDAEEVGCDLDLGGGEW